jgi:hypothetical protein
MPERRPIVIVNGRQQELPAGDSLPSESIPSTSEDNAVYAYDTTTQLITPANAWQDVTLNTNEILEDWTHTPGSADFVCAKTDRYLVTMDIGYERNGGGNAEFAVRALFNGSLVAGSQLGLDIQANNVAFKTGRTFILSAVVGQIFKIQVASNKTTVSLQPGPDPVGGGAPASVAVTLRR